MKSYVVTFERERKPDHPYATPGGSFSVKVQANSAAEAQAKAAAQALDPATAEPEHPYTYRVSVAAA